MVKADYPEHQVSRPTIMKPTNQLQSSNDASWGAGGSNNNRQAAGMGRRLSQQQDSFSISGQPINVADGPSMNRVRQMESSIQLGAGRDGRFADVVGSTMTSTAQESYTPLPEGTQKSRMTRPRTSNRIQEWSNGNAELRFCSVFKLR